MLKIVSYLFLTACVFSSCTANRTLKTGVQLSANFKNQISVTVDMNYLLYLPQEYSDATGKFPLMLFLHGRGERGNDIQLVKRHGPPKLIDQGTQFPFIVLAPQCPDDVTTWNTDALQALLSEIIATYNVDEDRIFVTGLSMGGRGTWELAVKLPHLFAAIVPICGDTDTAWAGRIAHIPVWVFHGTDDVVVPFDKSAQMVQALKDAGSTVKFTVYQDTGHDSWTETYQNDKLYNWLLSHKRSK
jgi:predicted peptidase